jgi:uncharacterized protein YkwD
VAQPSAAAAKSACARWGNDQAKRLERHEAARAVRCLVNRRREARGLHRLEGDPRLGRAAQRHTRHMKRHECFSHKCPGEPSPRRRLERVGYITDDLRRYSFGENIGWGTGSFSTPRAMVPAWMRSAGHRRNILDRDFRDLGVGFVRGTPTGRRDDGGTSMTDFGLRVK